MEQAAAVAGLPPTPFFPFLVTLVEMIKNREKHFAYDAGGSSVDPDNTYVD